METPLPDADPNHTVDADVGASAVRRNRANTTALQKDPLVGLSNANIESDARSLAQSWELDEYADAFAKGALLAKVQDDDYGFEALIEINDEEKAFLRFEVEHANKSLPVVQWLQAALCALCAVVQGMDQTIINGAQVCTRP